jgi:hypothetical protein
MNARRLSPLLLLWLVLLSANISAQDGLARPRVVGSASAPAPTPTATPIYAVPRPTPTAAPKPTATATPIYAPRPTPPVVVTPTPRPVYAPTPYTPPPVSSQPPVNTNYPPTTIFMQPLRLPYNVAKARSEEARRYFRSRTLPTATRTGNNYFVTLAAFDPNGNRLHYLTLPKTAFLTPSIPFTTTTSFNKTVNVRVARVNGVNTAIIIYDETGRQLAPLLVEYPIERDNRYFETAYYSSAHPALLSPEMTRAGQLYVRNTIEAAARELSAKGVFIQPSILDVAERLCTVEHIDHTRFRSENQKALFYEVFSLYALNEGDTYRYSVSTAGAGGMVQMIPATYLTVRNLYPSVNLIPDFVAGMRNHVNAAQAMLLYMQYTWNDLQQSETIRNALANGVASQAELLSAGYNSNPSNLPRYVARGGNGWRSLIPNETKMYLQIYSSLEINVPMRLRYDPANVAPPAPAAPPR